MTPPDTADPFDRLMTALRAARRAETGGADARAIGDAFVALGSLYAALDPRRPEVSNHLSVVYDACLEHIGEAAQGRPEGIDAALALLSPVRAALAAA